MKDRRVRAIRHVALRMPQAERTATFLEESWGLIPVGAGEFRGTVDTRPLVTVAEGPAAGIDHVSFAAADRADVDAVAARVQRLGMPLVHEPGLDAEGVYRMRCLDGYGLMLEVAETRPTRAEPAPHVPFLDRPMLISHVVLNTPDLEGTADLYQELFGFEVSDRYGDYMAFLRCNRYHHSLALGAAEHTSLNHIAFEVGSIDGVMRSGSRLQHRGSNPVWGPGRHGPGDNVFSYFADPSGLVLEYTSGLEVFDEDEPRAAKVWPMDDPEQDNIWGTGDPTEEGMALMLGAPDPYLRSRP
ncbi:VOC family protein [Streptomyces atratus]|uniref:VOC family protein n=1 Tax=Streptomyces atratus TaxID=1893 RepID=UPI00167037C9|nr:VOC family protein [Streptomyces atratus]WPW26314.1 VOC family protein [Streptomyces atratus]GGT65891.1 oxidoreductase [Streptomyces atratus]